MIIWYFTFRSFTFHQMRVSGVTSRIMGCVRWQLWHQLIQICSHQKYHNSDWIFMSYRTDLIFDRYSTLLCMKTSNYMQFFEAGVCKDCLAHDPNKMSHHTEDITEFSPWVCGNIPHRLGGLRHRGWLRQPVDGGKNAECKIWLWHIVNTLYMCKMYTSQMWRHLASSS